MAEVKRGNFYAINQQSFVGTSSRGGGGWQSAPSAMDSTLEIKSATEETVDYLVTTTEIKEMKDMRVACTVEEV